MRGLINSLKVAALFAGTVIGAGFATGRELCLYFADGNIASIVISSVFMGLFCYIFLHMSEYQDNPKSLISKAVNYVTVISAFFVYAVMLAAAEEIVSAELKIPLAGLFLAISAALFSNSINMLKKVNFLLIPFLLTAVIIVSMRSSYVPLTGGLRPISAIGYAAMNMLFAAKIMRSAGKGMSSGQKVLSSAATAVFIFALMFCMITRIAVFKQFSMPFLILSAKVGCANLGIIVILIAIFTTVTSCNNIVSQQLSGSIKQQSIRHGVIIASGSALALAGFMRLVNIVYPIISAFGIIICAYSFAKAYSLSKNAKKLSNTDNNKVILKYKK